MKVPKDFAVKVLKRGKPAKDRVTCGTCGLSWDDAIATSYTPAPSGRCPFEYYHVSDEPTKVTYLVESDVIGKRQTKAPYNRSRTGYGSKLPTSWEIQLKDKRWRRVYVICYSNSGSPYILVKGKSLFLGSYDPSYNPTK